MLLQSTMAEAHLAQNRGKASAFTVFNRSQYTLVKEAHFRLKKAKADLTTFNHLFNSPARE